MANEGATYDQISEAYQRSESASLGKNRIKDRFKLFLQANKPRSLLDLGCGSGVFARIAYDERVETVLGVDISSAQIEIARSQSDSSIGYLGQDITTLSVDRRFDAVSSVFGFCYAPSLAVLRQQLQVTYDHLADNGSVFAVICHTEHPVRNDGQSYRVSCSDRLRDGARLQCNFILDGEVVASDEKFYWSKPTWEKVLRSTGFHDIAWQELSEHSTNIVLTMKKL